MECELEGSRPMDRPQRTWREVVQKGCQARKLKREDAVDCIGEEADKGWLMIT